MNRFVWYGVLMVFFGIVCSFIAFEVPDDSVDMRLLKLFLLFGALVVFILCGIVFILYGVFCEGDKSHEC